MAAKTRVYTFQVYRSWKARSNDLLESVSVARVCSNSDSRRRSPDEECCGWSRGRGRLRNEGRKYSPVIIGRRRNFSSHPWMGCMMSGCGMRSRTETNGKGTDEGVSDRRFQRPFSRFVSIMLSYLCGISSHLVLLRRKYRATVKQMNGDDLGGRRWSNPICVYACVYTSNFFLQWLCGACTANPQYREGKYCGNCN